MPTPLFPEDNQAVKIKQGRTGNCYQLATLDCLLNGPPEYRAHVKSLFKVLDDGSIQLKLPHSQLAQHLKIDKLAEKGYAYQHETEFDVFTISPSAVQRIDNDRNGVQTNSLATKLIEHLSSYYYVGNWAANNLNSVFAHNINDRHGNSNSSTEFMGALLGIQATDKPGSSIEEIIRMKAENPNQPIYISMDYGRSDANGNIHGRHALRIKEIIPDRSAVGGFKFVLVNPWQNQSTEEYSLSDIQNRRPRFSVMSLAPSPAARAIQAPPIMAKAALKNPMPRIDEEEPFKKISPIGSPKVALTPEQAKVMIDNATATKGNAYVTECLFNYFYTQDKSYLTSAGGLRQAFIKDDNLDPLMFIKQLDISSPEINTKIVKTITQQYMSEKGISDISTAQKNLFLMIKHYKAFNDPSSLTNSAKVRELFTQGVLEIDNILSAFPESARQEQGAAAVAVIPDNIFKIQNTPFSKIKDHYIKRVNAFAGAQDDKLPELKVLVEKFLEETALHGSKDLMNKIKQDDYLQNISKASNFSEIKQIASQALSNLSKESSSPKALRIFQKITDAESSQSALDQLEQTNDNRPSGPR